VLRLRGNFDAAISSAHSDFSGDSLQKIARMYNKFNRHQESLALLQERLQHLRCILPEDHPHIGLTTFIHCVCLIGNVTLTLFAGDAMRDVGQAYRCLGLHNDALMLLQKTLEFRRRVLPKDHPGIGAE